MLTTMAQINCNNASGVGLLLNCKIKPINIDTDTPAAPRIFIQSPKLATWPDLIGRESNTAPPARYSIKFAIPPPINIPPHNKSTYPQTLCSVINRYPKKPKEATKTNKGIKTATACWGSGFSVARPFAAARKSMKIETIRLTTNPNMINCIESPKALGSLGACWYAVSNILGPANNNGFRLPRIPSPPSRITLNRLDDPVFDNTARFRSNSTSPSLCFRILAFSRRNLTPSIHSLIIAFRTYWRDQTLSPNNSSLWLKRARAFSRAPIGSISNKSSIAQSVITSFTKHSVSGPRASCSYSLPVYPGLVKIVLMRDFLRTPKTLGYNPFR